MNEFPLPLQLSSLRQVSGIVACGQSWSTYTNETNSVPVFQEIGDVENWARSIEMDMRTIATALEYVHKGQLQSASS